MNATYVRVWNELICVESPCQITLEHRPALVTDVQPALAPLGARQITREYVRLDDGRIVGTFVNATLKRNVEHERTMPISLRGVA